MKVLQINCVYPFGSTGKITAEIHEYLKKTGNESVVLCSRGNGIIDENIKNVCSVIESKINHMYANITGLMYGGCFFQTSKIKRIIKKENPDIVHLQCVNGYFVNIYDLIKFLNKSKLKTIITMHAEFLYTANCALSLGCENWKSGCEKCPDFHRSTGSYIFDRTSKSFELLKRAFEHYGERVKVVGVSDWLAKRAAESPIMNNLDITRIYNGIDTNIFRPFDNYKIREKYGIDINKKIIIWVTSSYSEDKGNIYFQKLIERFDKEEYTFVVVGVSKPDSIITDVLFMGKIINQNELAELYSCADVAICCSKQESYPTVFLEAQCCGTPVVGFDVGGVTETIYTGMGEAVPLGDIDGMVYGIKKWSSKKYDISYDIISNCRTEFSTDRMNKEYLELYKSVLG